MSRVEMAHAPARCSDMLPSIPHFLFIAVVYNDFADTEAFCRSLQSQDRSRQFGLECLIVDNSTDSTVSAKLCTLTQTFDFVSILRPDKNVGYFGGLNYALERCDCSKCSCVVLCNNDLEFASDFCKVFMETSFSNDTFVVCPDVVTLDGFHQNPHVLRPLSRLSRVRIDLYFSNYYAAAILKTVKRAIDWVMPRKFRRNRVSSSGFVHMGIGACYLLLPQFFSHFSTLHYPFFLYGEEAFLSAQVHEGGGRLYYCSALSVRHKESATLSKLPTKVSYEYARSGYRTYRKLY
jgi:GT2 family glycosyltransferase